jgi:hypothetical protein
MNLKEFEYEAISAEIRIIFAEIVPQANTSLR